jgi:predicted nucleic acid-binding protein
LLAERYLVDTNVLLRLFVLKDKDSAACQHSVATLRRQNIPLHFTLQNASEFWNTCTRPLDRNGAAMEPSQVGYALRVLLTQLTVLPDTADVFNHWLALVTRYDVRGVQVHDAKLIAAMKAHGIPAILTMNDRHFRRYDIQVATPGEIS